MNPATQTILPRARLRPPTNGLSDGAPHAVRRPEPESPRRLPPANSIEDHMGHEERDTLSLVQRVVTEESYKQIEKRIGRAYPIRLTPTILPWVFEGLTGPARDDLWAKGDLAQRIIHRLGHRRFVRRHDAAFRYAGSA
ncbi:hypothetical protein [Aldersonia kunmingensis]|uniref:hypothetical protein n=1 Tax=Aldersonia kunmingensis TaxID=408066 RepID=UPI0008312143|nr:hypothetical protein [Aldersonia kunmingensis]